MPTEDTSQTTRTKMISGRALSTYHILNPQSPQGGRYNFPQSGQLSKKIGDVLGGCCDTIATPTLMVPDAPTSVLANSGYTRATISFTVPVSDGGSPITSYTVTSTPEGITATGSSSPIIVSGLTNGTSYTFTVVATNSVGDSEPSSTSPASIPGDAIIGSLTTSLTNYQSAATDDWVNITSAEYTNLTTNISGTTKVGGSDAVLSVTASGGLANNNSALIANSVTIQSPAIPANNYLYAFAVRWGTVEEGIGMRVYTNTNSAGTNGFTQVGSVLPTITTVGLSYYVRKGVSTTNGATAGTLACFTGTKMNYSNPNFTGSAGYIGFTTFGSIIPKPIMRFLLGNGSVPGDNSTLTGGISDYGAFVIQGLTSNTKQWQ